MHVSSDGFERRSLWAGETSAFRANFNDIVRLAAEAGASDLHIEPMEDAARIRMRVDGGLRLVQMVRNKTYAARFLQEAKKACGFDVGLLGVPQDCRFRCEAVAYDLRASLIPTMWGEKIVLRLLQRGKSFSLDAYGMPGAAKDDLRRVLGRWQGLVLITGPTGSGKTTLLYSALSAIDAVENNVHTLEDPVEYELAGLGQSSIGPRDMSFADALRSLMRQDPDVIMVGEIRDSETAKAAIHAAATGHLVLSTVHANSAQESVSRLEDLGVTRQQTLQAMLYASAQRLLPRLCPACSEEDLAGSSAALATFGKSFMPRIARGCEACQGTGVAGRVLLFEYLTFEQNQQRQHGSLREHALEYLEQGVVDVQTARAFA